MNCLTILLIYKIGAKMVSSLAGAIAACAYAVLSLDSSVLGFAGHATHLVVFWAMAGLLVLLYAAEKNRLRLYLAAGVLLSLAFIMKQPGVFFALFWLRPHCRPWSSGQKTDVFESRPVLHAASSRPWPHDRLSLCRGRLGQVLVFYLRLFIQLRRPNPACHGARRLRGEFSRRGEQFLPDMGVFLSWACCPFFPPGAKERAHIDIGVCRLLVPDGVPWFLFQATLFCPASARGFLLAAILLDYVYVGSRESSLRAFPASGRIFSTCIALAVFATAVIVGLGRQSDYLFEDDPVVLCRTIYGGNPFPESVEIGRFIEAIRLRPTRSRSLGPSRKYISIPGGVRLQGTSICTALWRSTNTT